MKQYAAVDDTVYFWFAGNDTSGSGGDGASPAADVRLAGAAADAAPVYSPTPSLLSHINYPAGAYEIAITASTGNGFAVNNTYAVFCTLAIDSQNPTGFVGSFDLKPVSADAIKISGDSTAADNLELDYDGTGYAKANSTIGTCTTNTDLVSAAAVVNEWESQSQADPTGFHVNVKEVNGTAQTANDNGADINSILTDTAEIGAAGVGLTDLGGMSTSMKAEVESEANDALIALNLDHLMKIATGGADMTTEVVDNTVLSRMLANGDTSAFVPSTGGLQPIRDRGDSAWPTATSVTVSDKTDFALSATGANLILKDSTFALAIADAIWDEILTGATHNIANSAGRRVREIGAYAIHSGTAQAGNATCITLAATASAIDGTYNRNLLVITDNTGVGQTRTIIDYDGSTKIAIIDREWRTNPDATTVYQIVADDTPLVVDQGVAQAGSTSSTIKLRAYASSTNDIYLCNIVIIVAGTGRGQARLVGGYDGSSKVVTLCGDNWVTTPDNTSVYVMIPYGATCTSCVGDDALAQINAEVDTALNTAIPGSPTADSINQRIKAIDELTEGSGSGDLAAILTDTNTTIPGTISTLQTDSTAIKAKTDNLPSGIAKNVALPKFDFLMVLSSDDKTAATGKTITGQISKDGGSFTGITNAITEVGSGMYVIASGLTQAEMNADIVTLKFTETDCNDRIITIHTS